jgi:hypothetical protein
MHRRGVKAGADASRARYTEVMHEAFSIAAVIAFCVLAVLVVRLGLWIIGPRTGTPSRTNRRQL